MKNIVGKELSISFNELPDFFLSSSHQNLAIFINCQQHLIVLFLFWGKNGVAVPRLQNQLKTFTKTKRHLSLVYNSLWQATSQNRS